MIAVALLLLGMALGVLVGAALRHRVPAASNPMLIALRDMLETMERDYRLRVATEELDRPARPPLDRL